LRNCIILAFPAGRAFRSYYTGLSHGPVYAAIPNAKSSEKTKFIEVLELAV